MNDLLLALGNHIFAEDKQRLYRPPVEVLEVTRTLDVYAVGYSCETDFFEGLGPDRLNYKIGVSFEESFEFMWQHFAKGE